MLKYYAKHLSNLTLKTNSYFSNRTVSSIDIYEYESFTKVVLNRPKVLNSLNTDMILALKRELPNMNKAKAVWFEGAGGKAFCAGADIKQFIAPDARLEDKLFHNREQFTTQYRLSQLKALQIANWDGIVMGSGYGITSMAPFRIATENTVFAMPEARLGFFTDVCSCYNLSRLRNNIGLYLGMTGSRLTGEDVYIAGLANFFIPRTNLEAAFNEIMEAINSSVQPHSAITSILSKYHRPSGKTTIPHEQKINQIFGIPDFREIYKKVRSQTDEFSVATTRTMNELCPPSVGVIHKLIVTAKDIPYRDCFIRDFKVSQHYLIDPNFHEGVRTVLINKGDKPFWSHKSILDVTDAEVNKYFQFPDYFQELNI